VTAPAVVVKRTVHAREGHTLWLIDCPYCGREHTHGGAPGHRVAHCGRRFDLDGLGYVITEPARWREGVDARQARRAADRQLRAELLARRLAGKARGHAQRLRRERTRLSTQEDDMTTTTKTPDGPPCPGCGVDRTETADQEHGGVLLCVNPKCAVDK
jgi:hypothetical protein